jgi:hypothetical protein
LLLLLLLIFIRTSHHTVLKECGVRVGEWLETTDSRGHDLGVRHAIADLRREELLRPLKHVRFLFSCIYVNMYGARWVQGGCELLFGGDA